MRLKAAVCALMGLTHVLLTANFHLQIALFYIKQIIE